jgi:hypothetical protein
MPCDEDVPIVVIEPPVDPEPDLRHPLAGQLNYQLTALILMIGHRQQQLSVVFPYM